MMCWKRIAEWFKPDPPIVPWEPSNKIALLFGINNYGGSNNLYGCLNDVDDAEKKLRNEFPEFKIRKLKDSEVTIQRFISEIENALNTITLPGVLYIHYSGHGTQVPNIQEANRYDEALYLYNGPLVDDNIWILQQKTPDGLTVLAEFDSCFSADMNRSVKNDRFYKMPGVRLMRNPVRKFNKSASDRWVIFSGCGEEQTSADAWFNGRPNGAFSYYDLRSFNVDSTYKSEIAKLRTFLPDGNFDQIPELYGNSLLFDNTVLK